MGCLPKAVLCGVLGVMGALYAQGVLLKGRIENTDGEALGHALVRLPESGFQVLARGDGAFELNLLPGRTIIEVRYLGFHPHRETLSVVEPGPAERTFRLRRQEVRLPSVVITEAGVNPAEIIIRRAIQRKTANQACLPACRSEIYSLFTVRLLGDLPGFIEKLRRRSEEALPPGGVLFMSEGLSEVDYQPPNQYKETIRYSRIVGSRSYGFTGLWVLQGFDPYQERLSVPELTQGSLVLPLANDALAYYRYTLVGEIWEADGFVYKIAFTPRNPKVGLTGYLLIADESYAIRGVEGFITEAQGTKYVDKIQLRMQYVPVGSCWAPAEIQLQARLKLEVLGQVLRFGAEGSFLYRKYALLIREKRKQRSPKEPEKPSTPLPEAVTSTFRLDTVRVGRLDFAERLRILEGAERLENTFWDSLRKVPLDSAQIQYMAYGDSLLQAEDSLEKQRASRFQRSFSLGSRGVEVRIRGYKGWRSEWSLAWPAYTQLEGWVLRSTVGFQYGKANRVWEADWNLRYGAGWGRLLPEGVLRYRQNRFPRHTHEIRGGWQVREGPDQSQIPLLWNTFYYLARREAPLLVYDRLYMSYRSDLRWHREWESSFSLTWDRRPFGPEREAYYEAYRVGFFTEWVPGTQLYRTPRTTILLPSDKPIQLRWVTGHEFAKLPTQNLWSGYVAADVAISISPWGVCRLWNSLSFQSDSAPWADRLFVSGQPLVFHRYLTDMVFWPLYEPGGRWVWQGHGQWDFQGSLFRYLPLLRKTAWQEHIAFRMLYTNGQWHGEVSMWLTRISLGIGKWRSGASLSLGAHYGLVGNGAGLWRVTVAIGTPALRAIAHKGPDK